jgi:hypothetical protein
MFGKGMPHNSIEVKIHLSKVLSTMEVKTFNPFDVFVLLITSCTRSILLKITPWQAFET